MAIIKEIKNIKGNKSDWKKFGITMGIILSIIGFSCFGRKIITTPIFYFLPQPSLLRG